MYRKKLDLDYQTCTFVCRRYYEEYFGVAVAMSSNNYRKVNGFSNQFWGWGSEDDDFYNRLTLCFS